MIKTLSKAQKMEREKFRIPRSVQDAIPIRRIFADGIFQVGNQYSKTWSFTDINYAIASKEDKTSMFLDYSELLNALDSGASAKITIYNRRINKAEFERSVLLPDKDDGFSNIEFWGGYAAPPVETVQQLLRAAGIAQQVTLYFPFPWIAALTAYALCPAGLVLLAAAMTGCLLSSLCRTVNAAVVVCCAGLVGPAALELVGVRAAGILSLARLWTPVTCSLFVYFIPLALLVVCPLLCVRRRPRV